MNTTTVPHKRLNLLTGEWVLVSPHRMNRPWQGKQEIHAAENKLAYDPHCYLCPKNSRTSGEVNPDYPGAYAFNNDFPALLDREINDEENSSPENLLIQQAVRGITRVICFTPRHDLTLPLMDLKSIKNVISLWILEFKQLASHEWIKNILIFENKGEIMGCSNPHPHGQIWAQGDLPNEIIKETQQMREHFNTCGKSLLSDYLELELKQNQRIVLLNEHFVCLVPYWATWPFEVIIISRRQVQYITQFNNEEISALAAILKSLTIKYDNLFNTSFPYSAGMHQAPVNDGEHPEWHWHMHFYPPLLRSATVKKFMVGYELLATPQRDLTAELAAQKLAELPSIHYTDGI